MGPKQFCDRVDIRNTICWYLISYKTYMVKTSKVYIGNRKIDWNSDFKRYLQSYIYNSSMFWISILQLRAHIRLLVSRLHLLLLQGSELYAGHDWAANKGIWLKYQLNRAEMSTRYSNAKMTERVIYLYRYAQSRNDE